MTGSERAALLTLELPNEAEAVGAARTALTALNGDLRLLSEVRLRDTQLLVSELVTNAFRHAQVPGEPVQVAVLATDDVMRVEVHDLGTGFDPATLDPPSAEVVGGWGLRLVGIMATRWGVDVSDGTTVWFEIDRPSRSDR